MNDENTINNDEIIQKLEEIRKGLWAMAQEVAPCDDLCALMLTLYKVKIEEIQHLLQTHPLHFEQPATVIYAGVREGEVRE